MRSAEFPNALSQTKGGEYLLNELNPPNGNAPQTPLESASDFSDMEPTSTNSHIEWNGLSEDAAVDIRIPRADESQPTHEKNDTLLRWAIGIAFLVGVAFLALWGEGYRGLDRIVYRYNIKGNLIDEIHYNSNIQPAHTRYNYSNDGNIVKAIFYDTRDGSVSYWTDYEYDNDDSLIVQTVYSTSGSRYSWVEYTYDINGNRISETQYFEDKRRSWFEHTYDADGNCIETIYFKADGTIIDWTKHKYDADGNEIEMAGYQEDGSVAWRREFENDFRGNKIKQTDFAADGEETAQHSFLYDDNGNCLEEFGKSISIGGTKVAEAPLYRYEYDSSGNRIKETICGAGGSIKGWWQNKYNANGDITVAIWFDGDGTR